MAAVLGLGLLFGAAYVGYWYGTQQAQQPEKPTPVVSQPTPTPTPEPTPAVEDETRDWESFSNREVENNPTLNRSFKSYGFRYPKGWQLVAKEGAEAVGPGTSIVELAQGQYKIIITQAAMGGTVCVYPGEPEFDGPHAKYTIYEDIVLSPTIVLRRSGTGEIEGGIIRFTICQSESTSGRFGEPTSFGRIECEIPTSYDDVILDEIDQILSTFKFLE